MQDPVKFKAILPKFPVKNLIGMHPIQLNEWHKSENLVNQNELTKILQEISTEQEKKIALAVCHHANMIATSFQSSPEFIFRLRNTLNMLTLISKIISSDLKDYFTNEYLQELKVNAIAHTLKQQESTTNFQKQLEALNDNIAILSLDARIKQAKKLTSLPKHVQAKIYAELSTIYFKEYHKNLKNLDAFIESLKLLQ